MTTEETEFNEIPVIRLDPTTLDALRPSSGDHHFTGVVAPLLLAFTLPTIAVLATTEKLPAGFHEGWRRLILGVLVTAAGFLLAGSQLSAGSELVRGTIRAVLTYCGTGALTTAVVLLMGPSIDNTPGGNSVLWAIPAAVVVVVGFAWPTSLRIRQWWRNRHRVAAK